MNSDMITGAYAPIILFVYNRLDHVHKVVNALLSCPESKYSELFIYSDAAKDEQTARQVEKVRAYIHSVTGFLKVHIIERQENWGIERTEIDAISFVINRFGKAIMVEDDIVVSVDFLKFLNAALVEYEDNMSVGSVTGYSFIGYRDAVGLPETAFIKLASVWGWGTWATRWNKMRDSLDKRDIVKLCRKKYRDRIDMGYNYSDMIYMQYVRHAVTWDVLWYYTLFDNDMLTLIPTKTMVNNIGMDGSGVHYSNKNMENRLENINTFSFSGQFYNYVKENQDVNSIIKKTLQSMAGYPDNKLAQVIWEIKEIIKWLYRRGILESLT